MNDRIIDLGEILVSDHYKLWKHIHDTYGLLLIESELQEIVDLVKDEEE